MFGKKLMLVLVFIGGGLALVLFGGKTFLHTRKLAANGKPTVATVTQKNAWNVYKEQKTHHLTLAFKTAEGAPVTNDVMVTEDIYDGVQKGSPINIFYLPADPSICVVGDHVEVKYSQFFLGWGFLGLGVVVVMFLRKHPKFGEFQPLTESEMVEESRPIATAGAQKIIQQMAPLTQAKHEFQKVDPKNFPHLDLQFYDTLRRFLEAGGYVFLEDYEDVTLRQSANNPGTFLRAMLGANGTIMAGIYHYKPPLMLRAAGAKEAKVLDLETQLSDGTFVCTSNAEDAGKLSQPAEVNSLTMGRTTPPDRLLAAHEQRIKHFMERSGAQPVRLENIADVRRAQDELTRLKAEHRRRTGLSREELQRLGGGKKGDLAADVMFEEIVKEHNRVNGHQAETVAR